MTATEIMRKHVITAQPDDLVADVAGKLNDAQVGCAVVVENEQPVGIITDRDICVRLDANWVPKRDVPISEAMTTDPVTVDPDHSVLELTRTMTDNNVRRLPVVDDGELVGIVTQDDLLMLLSEELNNLASTAESEAPPEEWGRAY